MSVEKRCASCRKPLIGRRSHAVTCGSTCRGIHWRAKKEVTVPLKVTFSVANFKAIVVAAELSSKTVNQYIIDRVMVAEVAQ